MRKIITTSDESLDFNENEWLYNGLDCCVTHEVLSALRPQLDNTSAATYDFSRSLQGPILEMNMRGLLVDEPRRKEVLEQTRKDIKQVAEQFAVLTKEGVGVSCAWGSHVQVGQLLYDVMGFPEVKKRNAQGRMTRTTNEDALLELQSKYLMADPLCSHLLSLRDLDKKRQWLETGIDYDGRFRTSFNIAGTNSGRLSSAESVFDTGGNLQNTDRRLREVLVADKGMKFANIDLEQADSRNLGALCWEHFVGTKGEDFASAYLDACESGDLHTAVCKMAMPNLKWGTDEDRKIADQKADRLMTYRDRSKRLGHASNYLITERSAAKKTRIPITDIRNFRTNYFSAFKCIPAYHEHVASELRLTQSLTTLLGRRRFFFGRLPSRTLTNLSSSDTMREAVAYCPQSMTGDEINQGLLKVWRANRVQVLLQVHDSILVQFPEELEDEIVPWLIECVHFELELKRGRKLVVPGEAKVGWNYGDYDEEKPNKNPDGLRKWKGEDNRKRQRKLRCGN